MTNKPTKNSLIQQLKKVVKKTKQKKRSDFSYPRYWSGYYTAPGKPVWSSRSYTKFSDEAYIKNVIAHSAINLIAKGAASVPWIVQGNVQNKILKKIQILLNQPNPSMGGAEFFEAVYASKLISGNSYIQAVRSNNQMVEELYLLRTDRIAIIAGKTSIPSGYRYTIGDRFLDFKVNSLTGQSDILHLKNFHPLDDWYGLSAVEAAAYSIDQHNQAGQWNQALLQNGARPSGALIIKGVSGEYGYLTDEQYLRIKAQVEEVHSGPANAGKPIILEGGIEWKEMSLSPKDMDFLNVKNSAARDIALAFGVPAQLLGIPGDNTYSNLAEARLALWEQTIIPLLENTTSALNNWLKPIFGANIQIIYDKNAISALLPRRESLWKRISEADFLSSQEKRALVGV